MSGAVFLVDLVGPTSRKMTDRDRDDELSLNNWLGFCWYQLRGNLENTIWRNEKPDQHGYSSATSISFCLKLPLWCDVISECWWARQPTNHVQGPSLSLSLFFFLSWIYWRWIGSSSVSGLQLRSIPDTLRFQAHMRFLGARFYFTTFGFLFFVKTNLLCDFASYVTSYLRPYLRLDFSRIIFKFTCFHISWLVFDTYILINN